MRIVVTGATGNLGTSLMDRLIGDAAVESLVGVARRINGLDDGAVSWRSADVGSSPLDPIFDGADAVVHLAWAIQPSHEPGTLWRTNVIGSRRVIEAAGNTGVPTLIHASSIGAYSARSTEAPVDESWPLEGCATSFYGRHKAVVEWLLDGAEKRFPAMRIVRMRPALMFKRNAATGIRRLFAGPFLPNRIVRPRLIPVVPTVRGLTFQAVHTDDASAAFHAALMRPVDGAFNLAAEPRLAVEDAAELLRSRTVGMSAPALRAIADLTWRLRLQPTPPGWLDLALHVPVMSSARAIDHLGWVPTLSAGEALSELLAGFSSGSDRSTPPLSVSTGGRFRRREIDGSAYRR